jgi:hypothetical protein
MNQIIKGKCPECGHGEIVETKIEGTNYSGYCPKCNHVVFGFIVAETDEP